MAKIISVSNLRAQIKHILNEVSYGRSEYIVEKFGEPTAVIISIEDFRLLQELKQKQASVSDAETSFIKNLEAIHQSLEASGYRSRCKEEIDAELEAERDSWDK